jgi:hydroxypyruvate isomerase
MRTFKPSVAWWCFADLGLEPGRFFRDCAEIGYAGIEFAPRELWPLMAECGLSVVAIRGHDDITHGLNDPSQHDRIEREIVDKLELANAWGNPVFVCFGGERKGLDDERGAANTAEGLRRVAKAADEAGVVLALELLNSKIDHPDYQCDHTSWGVKVIEWVDSPAVKLLYDIYHMQIMEGDIIRTIETNYGHFAHYHLAGNPGRHEPDASQEISYPPILRAIEGTGYDGYVGVEFLPRCDPIESLRAAFDLCRIH